MSVWCETSQRQDMAFFRTLVALVLAGVAFGQNQGRFFDASFSQDGDSFKWEADLDMGELERTVDQLTSSFDMAVGKLADTIEKRVDGALPIWMREGPMRGHDDDIEAITGDFGDGIDDGLEVHFENGEIDRVSGGKRGEPAEVDVVRPPVRRPTFSSMPFNPLFPFGGFNRPSWLNFPKLNTNWYEGPNVCTDRKEIDESEDKADEEDDRFAVFDSFQMEARTCQTTPDTFTCTTKTNRRGIHKTVTTTYKCCHGYMKEGNACTKVDMLPMPDTLQNIGATDFLSLTKSAGMDDLLTKNLTIFAPTNEAMQEFTIDLEAEAEVDNILDLDGDRTANEVYIRQQRSIDKSSMVMSHMTEGIHYANSLHDEQTLYSLTDNSSLRINTYSTVPPVATVNCARLVTINQHSANGVVHTIGKVLKPVTKSLAELIAADPQFSILKQLVSNGGLLTKLREPGQLTVFAPTDAAFRTLPEPVLEALLEGSACLDSVIKNHILPNVICTAAIQGKARTINLIDTYLLLEKTEEEKLFVEDAQIVAKDIVGTNGVMHIIDAPLIPEEAKPVKEVLESHNLTRFLDLLEAAEMLEELGSLRDVTVFAPSNKAIDNLPDDVREEIVADPDRLRNILNYHLVTPSLHADDISNNHIANTRAELPLRVNLYSRSPLLTGLFHDGKRRGVRMTAGCSPISNMDSRACGAIVHIVEKLFVVPKDNVVSHIEANEDFSIFAEMLQNTGLNETLVGDGPFTVLAPSDHVFRILPKAELDHLMENLELQEELVNNHVLKEHICCTGINPNTWLFMDHKRTLGGSSLHVRRSNAGYLMAGPSRITHCSAPTQNGLVHTVNHLLVSANPRRKTVNRNGARRPIFSAPGLEILFG